jgi:hypothetical protein
MEITNYDPAITLWAYSLATTSVFAVSVIAETEFHIYQDIQYAIAKLTMPTYSTYEEARLELIGELRANLAKALLLEPGQS